MSCVLVIAPAIVAGWPAITAAVTASIGALGFTLVHDDTARISVSMTRLEIEVDASEVLAGQFGEAQQLLVERDGVRAVFVRDARGQLRICLEGTGRTRIQLQAIGEELLGRVTQQYVYHRIVTELRARKLAIVSEDVAEDRTVRIRVRNA